MFERWSSAHIAAPQRADFWREAVCEAFLSMTPRIDRLADFRAMLVHRGLDRLALNKVDAPAHGVGRTPADLARGGVQYLFVNLNLAGRSGLRQFGRELSVRAGELLLIDSSAPYELEQPDDIELVSLAVPQPMLGSLLPAAIEQVARPLPDSPSVLLLANQLRTLAQWPHELNAAEAGWLSDLLVGMVRAVIAATAEAPSARSGRFLRRKLQSLLEQQYPDGALSPALVAQQAGVSLRTLQACFAQAGTTFGAELMSVRLERARALLLAHLEEQTIIDIAARCGFKSAAHLSRRFRDRYGVAPSVMSARDQW